MDDLVWGRNITFPWNNDIDDHHHQPLEIEEIFDFDSENMFINPIQQLHRTDSSASHQMVHHELASSFNNGFHELKNTISISTTATTTASAATSLREQPEYLLFAANSNNDDDISVIFSDCKNFATNNNISDASSGNSVSDDGAATRFGFSEENTVKSKRSRSGTGQPGSSNISFRQPSETSEETDSEAIAQMKEMMYRAAAFRPVSFVPAVAEKPKRKNVRVSSDPQTTAARRRRERISERIRVLQRLVPGGNKMDTASMLDEAANYLKFLRSQVKALEHGHKLDCFSCGTTHIANGTSQVIPYTYPFPIQAYFPLHHQSYCKPYPSQ